MERVRAGGRPGPARTAVTAALVLVSSAALTGGAGQAGAAAHPAGAGVTAPGTISTVAGGVGGPGLATRVSVDPCKVTYAAGQLFFGDNRDSGVFPSGGSVRELDPATDGLTTIAGTGDFGPLGLGGPAASALVGGCGAAADQAGNLLLPSGGYVTAVAARTGRFYGVAMTAGHIYAIAGNGTAGYSGVGGPAASAEIQAQAVAVDGAGNLLIASATRVEVMAARAGVFYGKNMKARHIYLLAGNGSNSPRQVHDGGPATRSGVQPRAVTVDGAGNVVIADGGNQRVRVVAVATGTSYGQAMTAGDIYTVAGDGTGGFSGDGGPATKAELDFPGDVSVDESGNLVISDSLNERVRVVASATGTFYRQAMTAGDIYTIAGNGSVGGSGAGGPATAAAIGGAEGTTLDGSGNLVIAGTFDLWVVAARTGTFYKQAMTAGDIYIVAGNGRDSFSGFSAPAAESELFQPNDTASGGDGMLAIAATDQDMVLVIAPSTGTFFGRSMTAGHLYNLAGDGTAGYSGDGGPAGAAELRFPQGTWVDGAGNVLIADSSNGRIRVVARSDGTFYGQPMTAGDIYTIAGSGNAGFSGDGGPATAAALGPASVAVDASGNLLITDAANRRIRMVAERSGTFYGQPMTAGDIYTVAGNGSTGFSGDGGPATSAEFNEPGGVAADPAGNLLVADSGNSRVRVVARSAGTFYGQPMTAGHIYTIAGTSTDGFSGEGGPAAGAELSDPTGVVTDRNGNVLIADSGNSRVRVVAASTGTFYQQPMTAGNIYTIAGTSTDGFSGDGGPATSAELLLPNTVAVDGAGNLYIDDIDGRIREVTG